MRLRARWISPARTLDLDALARAAQRAEHEFAGTRCGIMDQMIACHGRAGHALLLDTRSLERAWLPLPSRRARGRLQHDGRGTSSRRANTTRGAPTARPACARSRATPRDPRAARRDARTSSTAIARRRCRRGSTGAAATSITENARVVRRPRALGRGDFAAFGALMTASHASLRDDYEVSCPELDIMVGDRSGRSTASIGARMTGGGFGGCAVALVDAPAQADRRGATIARRYQAATGLRSRRLGDDRGQRRRRRGRLRRGARDMTRRIRIAGSIRCATSGCSCRRSATRGRGRGRSSRREPEQPPAYDPGCYLCPGNARADGERNPAYASTFAFDNDFPALARPSTPAFATGGRRPARRRSPERGLCRVVCFSPRHDLTLRGWRRPRSARSSTRGSTSTRRSRRVPWVAYAQIFENRGAMMGASNPHPHGQIWATEHVPNEPAREQRALRGIRAAARRVPAVRLHRARAAARASASSARTTRSSRWCRSGRCGRSRRWSSAARHVDALPMRCDDAERDALADILKRLTTRYDNLFEAPFPYSMGFHQQPMRRRGARRVAPSRALLSAAAALGERFASSWSASSCSDRRSAISRRRRPPRGCGRSAPVHYSERAGRRRRHDEAPRVPRAGGAAAGAGARTGSRSAPCARRVIGDRRRRCRRRRADPRLERSVLPIARREPRPAGRPHQGGRALRRRRSRCRRRPRCTAKASRC